MTRSSAPPLPLPAVHWLGDSAVLLDFHALCPSVDQGRLRVAARCVRDRQQALWLDVVEAPQSLTLHYDASQGVMASRTVQRIARQVAHLLTRPPEEAESRHVEIPVCYDGQHAMDLADVCARTGLSTRELIDLHATATFEVQSIGFLPGFAYLGDLPDRLRLPRRSRPRARVPAGSVAISERFSGVYPVPSPGGWWLIGSTPLSMFKANRRPCNLLAPGDKVHFAPISAASHDRLAALSA